jgi:hypothetical protein
LGIKEDLWGQPRGFVNCFGPGFEDLARDMAPADDRDKRISLRVSPEMYAQIERAAEREHRTIAGWVKALIAGALDAPGASGRKR